jgi:hypothetical protein
MATYRATLSVPIELSVPDGIDPAEAFAALMAQVAKSHSPYVVIGRHSHYKADSGDLVPQATISKINDVAARPRKRATKWNVWSAAPGQPGTWLVVEEGASEKTATAGAGRRNAIATERGMSAQFIALPVGRTPHDVETQP